MAIRATGSRTRWAVAATATAVGVGIAGAAWGAPGDTILVSRDAGPAGAAADDNSFAPDISADGLVVAFQSSADNLAGGVDKDDQEDIFVRTLSSGALVLASRVDGAGGAAADSPSAVPDVSGDGRFVAFDSAANNLDAAAVAFADDQSRNIFVRDLQTNDTILASRASGAGGAGGSATSNFPSISANGRFVAFQSDADNLVPGDTNAAGDVFVRDLTNTTTTLVSRASGAAGAQGVGGSGEPSVSADGRYVAFSSSAKNLTPANTAGIFVRDLQTSTTILVSRAAGAGGAPADDVSFGPSISGSGQQVAFTSAANNLATAENEGVDNVFVRDLITNATTFVSRAGGAAGAPGNAGSGSASISLNGAFVSFDSFADNLDPASVAGNSNVFVRELATNLTTLVSRASGAGGAGGDESSRFPSISGKGEAVAFESDANNLSAADIDDNVNAFVRILRTVTTTPTTPKGTPTPGKPPAKPKPSKVTAPPAPVKVEPPKAPPPPPAEEPKNEATVAPPPPPPVVKPTSPAPRLSFLRSTGGALLVVRVSNRGTAPLAAGRLRAWVLRPGTRAQMLSARTPKLPPGASALVRLRWPASSVRA